MWVWSFNLYEAFRADCLITASRCIEIRRIVKEADRTFASVFVQIYLDGLTIHKGILRKLELARSHVAL
jgi:hypothetical protein